MKKYAFMFVAAALFAACGGEQKPAQENTEVEAPVEEQPVEVVLTAEDSAAVAAMVEGIEDEAVKDSICKAAFDSIVASKAAAAVEAVEEVAEEVAETTEE